MLKKINNFFDTNYYYYIEFPTERLHYIESKIKEENNYFQMFNNDIEIQKINVSTSENISKVYFKIGYYEYISIVFYVNVSFLIFIDFTKLGAIIFLILGLILRMLNSSIIKKTSEKFFIYKMEILLKPICERYDIEFKINSCNKPEKNDI